MQRGDKHKTPAIDFTGTKAQIEATLYPIEGMTGLATDNPTAPIGKYLSGSWQWFGSGTHTHDGWTAGAVQPTRSAADDPTYTLLFTGADLTGFLQEGSPFKLTQNSIVRYGWISSTPVYSSGNTTATVLTRCDDASANYDILDTSTYPITGFSYGLPKQPGFGMPISPAIWSVLLSDTTNRSQVTSSTTVYNLGSLSISAPIGTWRPSLSCMMQIDTNSGSGDRYMVVSLSTSSSTHNNNMAVSTAGSALTFLRATPYAEFPVLSVVSKTTYYVVASDSGGGGGTIYLLNALQTLYVSLECVYL